jgi:hypothetical protein
MGLPITRQLAREIVCNHPSCTSLPRLTSFCAEEHGAPIHHRSSGLAALPQGPSLRLGLYCPLPSSLTWPHPSHSPAPPDFAAERLIRAAFAVYTNCAPRRPMSGSALSLLIPSRHVVLYDPGEPVDCAYPVPSPTTLAFVHSARTRRSRCSHYHPLSVGPTISGLSLLQPAELFASLGGPDQAFTWPTETFTFGLPMGWSPFPPPNIATVATG